MCIYICICVCICVCVFVSVSVCVSVSCMDGWMEGCMYVVCVLLRSFGIYVLFWYVGILFTLSPSIPILALACRRFKARFNVCWGFRQATPPSQVRCKSKSSPSLGIWECCLDVCRKSLDQVQQCSEVRALKRLVAAAQSSRPCRLRRVWFQLALAFQQLMIYHMELAPGPRSAIL